MRIAKKGASISALVSLCSSLMTFGAILPASAAPAALPALTSLTSTISNPKLSDCNVLTNCNFSNNPVYEYTNVSYTWQLSQSYAFLGDSECVLNQGTTCVTMTITTDDLNANNSFEIWADTVTSTDITYSGPANTYVISATPSDEDAEGSGIKETLTIAFGCTAACTFDKNDVHSLDIVNQPMYTPYKSYFVSTNVYRSYPVTVEFEPHANYVGNPAQASQTVDNYGGSLNVTASIDASLSFQYAGTPGATFPSAGTFYTEDTVDSADGGCYFGTLTPFTPKICVYDITINTNAPNGFSVYVAQDHDMTFNGNTIKQFDSGTRTDDSAATIWHDPTTNAGAHLGYSSNDESVFPDQSGSAVWAGIPTMASANQSAASPLGLVADDNGPGEFTGGVFALKIESGPNQPQAISSLGQEYSNNLYFMVVGNF